MNLMRTAAEWLNKKRDTFLAEQVTFCHYGKLPTTVTLSATRGSTFFKAESDYGITIRVRSVDFLVSANQLTFFPEKGDEIICDGKKYEVLAPNNEPVYRWSDVNSKIMRIHTKEIGDTEDAN